MQNCESEYMNYSVLMSVYAKEKPVFLSASIESIYKQTLPTDDFVLVCDGPLNEGLDAVIRAFKELFGSRMRIYRLRENHGLGYALNVGIRKCKNELVARMDSDDIAMTDRCERQIAIFAADPEVDICSGYVQEFDIAPGDLSTVRAVPETPEQIRGYAKKRNPFNHPCAMYRKSSVMAAGGYRQLYMLEDYYLWIRMLIKGMKGYNIPAPILHMRVGNGMYKRRSGWKHARSQMRLFGYMYRKGFISASECVRSSVIRVCGSMMPNGVRMMVYKKVLR